MCCRGKTGEVVAYLLATEAGTLLHSVVAPIITRTDAREYLSAYSWAPGIQSDDGSVSTLCISVHVVVSAALTDGIALFASSDGTAPDSPPAGGDGNESTVGWIPEPTPTPTEIPTLSPVKSETDNTDTNNENKKP
jgi:hypothetical protein